MTGNTKYAKIIGIGSYLPETIMSNDDLSQMVDTNSEWILTRTGINQRHINANGMVTSDMATEASKKAIAAAGVDLNDIELIILATVTPDMPFPPTACHVQAKLGITKAAAFDLGAVCSGFLYSMSVAEKFIKVGEYKTILVIGVEMLSRIMDWQDRGTCVIFGDGAGAAVIQASDNEGILSTHLYSDGNYANLLCMPGGGTCNPASPYSLENRLHYIKMQGNEIFKLAVRSMTQASEHALETNGLTVSDVDLFIPHQANIRIIESTARKLGVSMDRVVTTVDRHANTSAASIPLAMDQANKDGRMNSGDTVLTAAFGGGLSWASALMRW